MQGGSVDLTTHQYAELLRVPLSHAASLMVYQRPQRPGATPPSLFFQDEYQMFSQQQPQDSPQPNLVGLSMANLSTTSVGDQFPDGCNQNASTNLGDTKRSSSLSHNGLPQGCQWPGQSSTEVPSITGQFSHGSWEQMLHSMQEAPPNTGQLGEALGLVRQTAAGAFEAGATPRVLSKRIVREPSFTQRGELAIHGFGL